MKKDKRHNDYFDNYSNKVKDTFLLGLVYAVIAAVANLVYFLFS